MNNINNKIDVIKKILDEIEEENMYTEVFRSLSVNSQRNFEDFDLEQIYFDLIKNIADQHDLPDNVCMINIYLDDKNRLVRYELISLASKPVMYNNYLNIIWE